MVEKLLKIMFSMLEAHCLGLSLLPVCTATVDVYPLNRQLVQMAPWCMWLSGGREEVHTAGPATSRAGGVSSRRLVLVGWH